MYVNFPMKESDVFLSSINICKYSNITKDVKRYYNIRMLRQETQEHCNFRFSSSLIEVAMYDINISSTPQLNQPKCDGKSKNQPLKTGNLLNFKLNSKG